MARYNRNPNPSFGDGTATGWSTTRTKAALRVVASTRGDGVAGNSGDARSNGTTTAVIQTTNSGGGLAAVVPGQQYVVSVYVYQGSGSTKNVEMDIDFANSSGGYVSTSSASPTVAVPNNTWTRISAVATVPSGCFFISTYCIFSTGADNVYIAVSCAMVEDGTSSPNYRDGGSSGWAWTGTSGRSPSQNLDPTAAYTVNGAASGDVTVPSGSTVALNSSASSDPEGSSLTRTWSVLGGGSFSSTTATSPTYTPPAGPTTVVLQLQVRDSELNVSPVATRTINVQAPYQVVDVTGSGGFLVGGAADAVYTRGNDVTGSGGLTAGGAADVLATLSAVVSGDGGLRADGSALGDLLVLTPALTTGSGGLSLAGTADPPLNITPTFVTGSGGLVEGGSALPPLFITPSFRTATGGLLAGGEAEYRYRAASVPANVVIEWDLDGDGRFTRAEENITGYVMGLETLTGRDYPSQLTGRAGPGKLRLDLLNQDNRFSHFNQASPLNNNGMALQVGSRIRVRAVEAVDPDSTLLAYDTFTRPNGTSLGAAESGQTWSGNFSISSNCASLTFDAPGNYLSILAVGTSTHYVQATFLRESARQADGTGNTFGVIYRWQNSANYSRLQYDVAATSLRVIDKVAGVDTVRASYAVNQYDGMVLGAAVSGTQVRYFLDGVELGTTTAPNVAYQGVGIFVTRPNQQHTYQRVDNFTVWNRPPLTSPGVLWTGNVADISESVELGPRRRVTIDAEGPLALAAATEVYPTSSPFGRYTGLVVGNTLARAGLLDPPGPIQQGSLVTGAFGYEKAKALEVCRDFEEAELGFLYETPEGRIGFDGRTARAGRTNQAVFADFEGAQLGYHKLEPRDWRREIVNRVEAGVASAVPTRENSTFIWTNFAEVPAIAGIPTNHLGVMWIRPSDAPTPIVRGQLLLAIIAGPGHAAYNSEGTFNTLVWLQPPGWVPLDDAPTFSGGNKPGIGDYVPSLRVYAKVADGNEGAPIAFAYVRGDLTQWEPWYGETYSATARLPYISALYNLDNFFGDVKDGVVATMEGFRGSSTSTTTYTPPTVFPDWGPEHPSTIITAIGVANNATANPKLVENPVYPPSGYRSLPDVPIYRTRNGGSSSANGASAMLAIADTAVASGIESPFNGWYGAVSPGGHKVFTTTIAVRGKNGSPPIKSGHVTVQRDDMASQRKYRVIRTHREESNLFRTADDATAYGDLVLSRFANERPIMALSFWANTTVAHRTQALNRRVGDRIRVESNNATGLNYSGDYFIESIGHRITNGGKQWEVTYELSPA